MKNKTTEDNSAEYKNMVDLLAVFSDASNQMASLEAEVNDELLSEIDGRRAEYARLQSILTRTETSLEIIALAHPEWFGEKQSIKTPYGTVKFHSGSKLEVANPEVSILLVKQHAEKKLDFPQENYIRTAEALNLEALEKLDDEILKSFRIKRVPVQSFSVKAAKVEMGKAVKEAAEAKA